MTDKRQMALQELHDAYFQGVQDGENTHLHQGMQADKRGALSETRYLRRA